MAKRTTPNVDNSTDHVENSVPLREGLNGGKLRSGNPGNAGGGRYTKKFATFLKELRDDPDYQAAIERAAKDEESRGFHAVLKTVSDYDDEKPAEKKQIVGPVEVRVRFEREGTKRTAG